VETSRDEAGWEVLRMEWKVGDTVWAPRSASEWMEADVSGVRADGVVRVVFPRGRPLSVNRSHRILRVRDLALCGQDRPAASPLVVDGLIVFFGKEL